jgi:hypothetical protein
MVEGLLEAAMRAIVKPVGASLAREGLKSETTFSFGESVFRKPHREQGSLLQPLSGSVLLLMR